MSFGMQKKRRAPYLGNQLRPRCSVLENKILSCNSYSGLQFNSRSSLDSNSLFLLEENDIQQDRIYELWKICLEPTEPMFGLNGSNGVRLKINYPFGLKNALISPLSFLFFNWCSVVLPAYLKDDINETAAKQSHRAEQTLKSIIIICYTT